MMEYEIDPNDTVEPALLATDTSYEAWLALNPPPFDFVGMIPEWREYIQRMMIRAHVLWVLDEARKRVKAQVVEHDGSDIPF